MYIAILGRQPGLSMAELEQVFGSDTIARFSDESATVSADAFDIERLGGTLKAGKVVTELSSTQWRPVSKAIVEHYTEAWSTAEGKRTIGISAYGFDASPRDIQKTGIILKQSLKKLGVSVRLIPNAEPVLNTATSHHNKLGLSPNKIELLVVKGSRGKTIIAESTGAQNITALAGRDQARPKRDPFVGMLPPKLAQIMINLAGSTLQQWVTTSGAAPTFANARGGQKVEADSSAGPAGAPRLLDPFCGTGVILQEAALMGYAVYGTDLSEKMIRYSRENLNWLQDSQRIRTDWYLHEGDAMTTHWQQPIDAVVAETYLGQPFSAPPSAEKLEAVKNNVTHILTDFLNNLGPQLTSGTPLCLAVPAWRDANGQISRLPLSHYLGNLGYERVPFRHVSPEDLIYYREDQVVARELLVLRRT